ELAATLLGVVVAFQDVASASLAGSNPVPGIAFLVIWHARTVDCLNSHRGESWKLRTEAGSGCMRPICLECFTSGFPPVPIDLVVRHRHSPVRVFNRVCLLRSF